MAIYCMWAEHWPRRPSISQTALQPVAGGVDVDVNVYVVVVQVVVVVVVQVRVVDVQVVLVFVCVVVIVVLVAVVLVNVVEVIVIIKVVVVVWVVDVGKRIGLSSSGRLISGCTSHLASASLQTEQLGHSSMVLPKASTHAAAFFLELALC